MTHREKWKRAILEHRANLNDGPLPGPADQEGGPLHMPDGFEDRPRRFDWKTALITAVAGAIIWGAIWYVTHFF